jgi:phosphoribosyl 1,2-cyclic phosphodiesterase
VSASASDSGACAEASRARERRRCATAATLRRSKCGAASDCCSSTQARASATSETASIREAPIDSDLYLTHTHFDHVCGLPFFRPFFQQENTFRVWAGHLGGRASIQQVLWKFMMAPLFPVPPEVFRAT